MYIQNVDPIRWLVVVIREGRVEATPFTDELDAKTFFDRASLQWSDSYLCEVLVGPADLTTNRERPMNVDEIRAALTRIALHPDLPYRDWKCRLDVFPEGRSIFVECLRYNVRSGEPVQLTAYVPVPSDISSAEAVFKVVYHGVVQIFAQEVAECLFVGEEKHFESQSPGRRVRFISQPVVLSDEAWDTLPLRGTAQYEPPKPGSRWLQRDPREGRAAGWLVGTDQPDGSLTLQVVAERFTRRDAVARIRQDVGLWSEKGEGRRALTHLSNCMEKGL